jgi:hypothetical protein
MKEEMKMSSEREASIDAGISIWGECGEFSIDESVWRAWLTLARLHGWEPAGTASPAIDLETGFELDDSEREFLEKVGNDGGYGPPRAPSALPNFVIPKPRARSSGSHS